MQSFGSLLLALLGIMIMMCLVSCCNWPYIIEALDRFHSTIRHGETGEDVPLRSASSEAKKEKLTKQNTNPV